jgi:hypothetical protein
MKTVLLNGCSYTYEWNPTEWFSEYNIVNISKNGGSNRRAFRTTVEWILQNGNPDFVIVPLTFDRRTEAVFYNNGDNYRSYSPAVIDNIPAEYQDLVINTMVVEDRLSILDKLLTDIILFSDFLRVRSIPHLIFNACENFEFDSVKHIDYLTCKVDCVKQNSCVIDLETFCSNTYLSKNGALSDNINCNIESSKHFRKEDYYILENYLNTYRIRIEQEFNK